MAGVLPQNEANSLPHNQDELASNSSDSPNLNQPTVDGQQNLGANRTDNLNNQQNANAANNNLNRGDQARRFHGPRAHLTHISERIVFSLFVKFAYTYGRATSAAFRRLLEFSLLFMALTLLFLLVYMHRAFTLTPANCLDHIKDSWTKDGILRVEVIKNHDPNYSLEHSYLKEELLHHKQMEYLGNFASDLDLFFGSSEPVVTLDQANETDSLEDGSETEETIDNDTLQEINSTIKSNMFIDELEESEENVKKKVIDEKEKLEKIALAAMSDEYIVEYSLEYGFLRLSSATRKRLNITVQLVVLDPLTNDCFGDSLLKLIFDEILGYDDILMLSVKHLAESEENKGFLRNVVTGEHYKFVNMWMGYSNYVPAAIVMMIFTLSVSMLLRYSHHQIFMFIVDLLQMLELNGSMTFPAAEMLTVILALVGMEAIMSEYFKDTSTAFYIIVLVWFSNQYDAICCHTAVTKRHWLRFFYLYHFAFYSYHYRFNGQYSWLALMTSATFILHSMVYFFHHYELPALLQQLRMEHTGRIRTFNVVFQNVQQGVVLNEAIPNNTNPAWPGGPPGVNIRNPQQARNGTRLVNLMMHNIAAPVVPNQNGRRLFLQVLFENLRNLRNALRNAHNDTDGNVAAPATENTPDEPQQESTPPTVTAETNAGEYGVQNISRVDISSSRTNSQVTEIPVGIEEEILTSSNAASVSGTNAGGTDLGLSSGSPQIDIPQVNNNPSTEPSYATVEIRRRHRVDEQLIEGSRERSDQVLP